MQDSSSRKGSPICRTPPDLCAFAGVNAFKVNEISQFRPVEELAGANAQIDYDRLPLRNHQEARSPP
jgi:hypothetical protein